MAVNDLSGHYPFDLLVLRGASLETCRGRDSNASRRLRRLSARSGRRHEHSGSLFWPSARTGFRSHLAGSL